MSQLDLYGQAVKLVRNISAYAGLPGSGPEGMRCRDCAKFVRFEYHNRTYFKCGLGRITHGKATDIKATAPSCNRFETKAGADK